MNKENEQLLKIIEGINASKKIKIRFRRTPLGHFSVYLDIWHNNKRKYIHLRKYLKGTKDSLNADKEILRYIIAFRDQKELELLMNDTGFEFKTDKTKADFVEYFKSSASKKIGSTYRKWMSLYKHLYSFANGKIMIRSIDAKFCESFYKYLSSKCSYSTPIVYYKVFSAALNKLVLDGVILVNPAKQAAQRTDFRLKKQKDKEKPREFLTIEEIKKLIQTPTQNIQTKNAFLISCLSGLRLGDIQKLTFNMISEGYLSFKQNKTGEYERMKLHTIAEKIIQEQQVTSKDKNDKIFYLYDNKAINRHLMKWIKDAGIEKHISFHCARHSFATMCLTKGVDIYTVSKLLGHKDLESTQIYAKLIDKKKDEAIDKLPSF